MKKLVLLCFFLPLCGYCQLQKGKGYQFLSAEAGFVAQENFGYHGSLSYGRFVERNLALKLHLSYEDFGYAWLDQGYFVYERVELPDGTERLDSVSSPRERPGKYRSVFVSLATEVTLLSQYEAFYLGLEFGARAGLEELRSQEELSLSYGLGGGPSIELFLDPQFALLARLRYEYLVESGFEDRLSLIVGLRYNFR